MHVTVICDAVYKILRHRIRYIYWSIFGRDGEISIVKMGIQTAGINTGCMSVGMESHRQYIECTACLKACGAWEIVGERDKTTWLVVVKCIQGMGICL